MAVPALLRRGRAWTPVPFGGRHAIGAAVAAVWLLVVVVVLAATPSANRSSSRPAAIGYMVPLAVALVLLVVAAGRRGRHDRLFLGSFSAYVLLTVLGDVVVIAAGTARDPGAAPSAADALYLAAYLALLPGAVVGLRPLGGLRTSVAWFDAGITAASLALGAYVLQLAPLLRDPSPGKLIAAAYPLCDLVVLMLLIPVVLGLRSAPPGARLLLGSFAAAIVGDSAYSYFSLHGGSVFNTWFVLCYQVQFVLLALGGSYALAQRAPHPRSVGRGRDVGLPLALLAMVGAAASVGHAGFAGNQTRVERAGFLMLVVLLLGRMLLADRDLRRAERAERERGVELERLVAERTAELAASEAELRRSREASIRRLAEVIGLRDEETGEHIERISLYAALLGEQLGLDREQVELLRIVSPLHDIGKVAIPDAILRKPGPLTAGERAVMEQHTVHGHRLLSGSGQPLLDIAAELALSHHERWDGTGYPKGLAREAIPIGGRILAVCDVFDALTSDRVYRPALPLDEALAIMRAGRGTQFDPTVLDVFFASLPAVLRLREQGTATALGGAAA